VKTVRITRTEVWSCLVDVEDDDTEDMVMHRAVSYYYDRELYQDDRRWEVEFVEDEASC